MILHKDGKTIDVQPKKVGRYEAAGWSRTPPTTSRRPRRKTEPAEPAGDAGETPDETD